MIEPPKYLHVLKETIKLQYPALSKRLQQVAQFIIDQPHSVAFGTVAAIAKDAGVHPSTLVRFANAFGYTGFSQMQRLFQDDLVATSPSYSDRIRITQRQSALEGQRSPKQLLDQFTLANSLSLEEFQHTVSNEDLNTAVDLLEKASAIYIIGVRRAFVVANYFAYTLRHVEQQAHLIDGMGGMFMEQIANISENDVVIAVSYRPYAKETMEVAKTAAEKRVPLIVITDSPISPISPYATTCFTVTEANVHSFRSLTTSLSLAQSLSIALAYQIQAKEEP